MALDSLFTDFAAEALGPLTQDILRGEHARAALALNGQKKLEEAQARITHASVEGLGELVCRVDPHVYFRLEHRFGAGCWNDDGFLKSLRQKNPGMFSPPRGQRKTTLRVDGLRQQTAPPLQ